MVSKKYWTLLSNLIVVAALSLVMACSEDSAPQPAEAPTDATAEAPAAGGAEAAPLAGVITS